MSGGGMPLAAIPLRDGSQLHITQEGVKIGERFFALASIQDARQVAPEPETVALRVAGIGLVEFQPARAGDSAVALEALFRLRPELRPAGFAPQTALQAPYPPYAQPYPGYPVYPQYPPYPSYMPGPTPGSMPPTISPQVGYPLPQGTPILPPPPPGFPPPPPPFGMPFAPNPNNMQGEMTPIPRDFGQLMGAIFQLYGKRFRSLLLLALCVVLPPALLVGGIETLFFVAITQSQPCVDTTFNGTSPASCTGTSPLIAQVPPADQLLLWGSIALGVVALLLVLLGAWQTAALSFGARAAVLGRPISVGASLRDGLRRIMPTLGAQILMGIILSLFLLPIYALFVLAFTTLISNIASMGSTQASHTSALFGAYFFSACALAPFCLLLYFYFWVRLGFAPYAAATMRLGPGRALAASWRLTRGNWWRTFFVIFLMTLIVGTISGILGQVAGLYPPAAYLVVIPAIQVLGAPLLALTYMVLLSDLRLRSEGYLAATQDTPSSGGAKQSPPAAEALSAHPGEATQQQQSAPPLG